LGAGGQQSLALAGGEEELLFAVGEGEGAGDVGDGLGCLAEQDLGGGVGGDGFAEVVGEDVGGVLGGDGESGPVFAGGFGHAEQEVRAGRLFHQQPGFVDDDQAGPAYGGVGDLAPDDVQGEQGAGGFEFVGQVPQGEHKQVRVKRGGGGAVEQS